MTVSLSHKLEFQVKTVTNSWESAWSAGMQNLIFPGPMGNSDQPTAGQLGHSNYCFIILSQNKLQGAWDTIIHSPPHTQPISPKLVHFS